MEKFKVKKIKKGDKTDDSPQAKKSSRKKKIKNKKNPGQSFKNAPENSLSAGILRKFGRLDGKTKDSLLLSFLPRLNFVKRFSKPFKKNMAKGQEESMTSYVLSRFSENLLSTPLAIYGLWLLAFGGFIGIWTLVLSNVENGGFEGIDYTNLIFAAISCILSFVFMLGSGAKPLASALTESRFASFFLFGLLGVDQEYVKPLKSDGISSLSAFIAGLIFGMIAMFIPPVTIITRLFIIIGAVIIFNLPESGVIISFIALPFVSGRTLSLLLIYVWICYIYKLMLGRRSFKLSFTDGTVVFFGLVTLFSSGLFGTNEKWTNGILRFGYILLFVLMSNIIKNRDWIKRCKNAIYISVSAVGLLSLFVFLAKLLLSYLKSEAVGEEFFVILDEISIDISSFTVFDNFGMVAAYLLLGIFFLFTGYDKKRFTTIFLSAVCIFVIGISASIPAWVGFIAGAMLFAYYKNKNNIYYIAGAAAALVGTLFIPERFIVKAIEFANIRTDDIAYRFNVWVASIRMAVANPVGTGISENSFAELYSLYNNPGAPTASNSHNLYIQTVIETGILSLALLIFTVFLIWGSYSLWSKSKLTGDRTPIITGYAGVASIVALLCNGLFDYLFACDNMYIMFIMILGFTYANCKLMRTEADGKEMTVETVCHFKPETGGLKNGKK